jgi:hypothetical protein
MGACCVGLASKRFAVGFDEDAGGALVDLLEDVVGVVEPMLADPDELRLRQARARAQARSMTDWRLFVERVGDALSAIEAETERSDAPWRDLAEQLVRRNRDLNDYLALLRAAARCAWPTRSTGSCGEAEATTVDGRPGHPTALVASAQDLHALLIGHRQQQFRGHRPRGPNCRSATRPMADHRTFGRVP